MTGLQVPLNSYVTEDYLSTIASMDEDDTRSPTRTQVSTTPAAHHTGDTSPFNSGLTCLLPIHSPIPAHFTPPKYKFFSPQARP